jgi:signal transduction histidine kinase
MRFAASSAASRPFTLRGVVSFVRRRYFVTSVAVAGVAGTWGLMMAFSWSAKLGVVSLAPWVALIGFDLGVAGGVVGAALTTVLWLIANDADGGNLDNAQIAVRAGSLLVLAVGSALAGQRLRASEEAHRGIALLQSALIDSTLDGICLTDAEGNILISNRPLRRLVTELGMPADGTVPERLLALSNSITEPARYRARMLELAHEPGEASTDEFEIAGTGRVFRGYTAPIPEATGGLQGRIWTLREVTADRELDRMRDAFVATVSHELRTPLTSISGFLEMMQDEEAGLGASGRQYLDVIRRSTTRLHALVEDLLLMAQIEAKRIELTLAPVDVQALAMRSIESARPAATEKGVTLELVADHPPEVLADGVRIAQVIDNLVSNAVKFTNQGGRVTVTVQADDGGDGLRLTVADTGIGIPLEEHGQIFSRFFRASTATRHAIPGTGLGLAISRALIEQHGGTITLTSREGEGTDVTVLLRSTQ